MTGVRFITNRRVELKRSERINEIFRREFQTRIWQTNRDKRIRFLFRIFLKHANKTILFMELTGRFGCTNSATIALRCTRENLHAISVAEFMVSNFAFCTKDILCGLNYEHFGFSQMWKAQSRILGKFLVAY